MTTRTIIRRIVGVALIGLTALPIYRLLLRGGASLIKVDVVGAADRSREMMLYGSLVIVLMAVVLARFISVRMIERLTGRVTRALVALPSARFASVVAMAGFGATAVFTHMVVDQKPALFDAMAQLLHARYFAEGQLTGAAGIWSPFIAVQNAITLPTGWVSQYPPGHIALLAVGFLVNAVWLVGPVMLSVTAFFTALAADRLLPDDRGTARLGAVLVAISPFLIGLAGTYMNHITAAAGIAAAMYYALRGRDREGWQWDVLTGFALAAIFTVRPLAAITTGIVVVAVWLDARTSSLPWRHVVLQTARATLGAVPLLGAVFTYNARVFGHPLHMGYTVAQGPAMGLGFHVDPWGSWYGPLQALAYTSSDLTALSLYLLETPLPAVLLCGLYLGVARQLSRGARIIALWAILPVLANALYWHHGIFMGPRMLNEAAPAWMLLTVVSVVGLVRCIPRDRGVGAYEFRGIAAIAGLLTLVGAVVYLAPQRLASYGGAFMASTRIPVPRTSEPSIVFVHGGWGSRVAMRLIGAGMRLDRVETIMSKYSLCVADSFAKAYAVATPAVRASLVPGPRNEVICAREEQSDRLGVVDITPLVWQGDLPGLPGNGAMIVRDLGPEANQALIRAFPNRTPLVMYRPESDAALRVIAYDAGMTTLWGMSQP